MGSRLFRKLFTFEKKKNMAKNSNDNDAIFNNLIQGTRITGDIQTDGNIKIDGHLVGTINAKGRVVIGTTGVIEGEISCKNAQISGKIIGKISVSELLTLKSTVNVKGDIITNKLAIEPGAIFTGTCKMEDAPTVQTNEKRQKK